MRVWALVPPHLAESSTWASAESETFQVDGSAVLGRVGGRRRVGVRKQ